MRERSLPYCRSNVDNAFERSPRALAAGTWVSIAESWRPTITGPSRYDALVLPAGVERVSLGEGGTPVVAAGDALLKCDHLNPTGSYKDRIAAVGISVGVSEGARGWIGTSSGNSGAAFAAYGARAGLRGRLVTIEGIVPEKLAQALAFGVDVCEVAGFGKRPDVEAEVFAAVQEAAVAERLVLGITALAFNRVAMRGARTIAFELVEQIGGAPAVVYVPTGGGGLLSSVWEGFLEWHRLGLADQLPRIVAVQPSGCGPIHDAARTASERVAPIPECRSSLSGLQLTDPPDGDEALAAVRASGGWTIAVDDEAAYDAQRALAREHGVFVEPAAAAAYAGYLQEPADGAVVLLTGSGLKTLGERRADVPRRLLAVPEIARWAGR
jgi:threonine synthase